MARLTVKSDLFKTSRCCFSAFALLPFWLPTINTAGLNCEGVYNRGCGCNFAIKDYWFDQISQAACGWQYRWDFLLQTLIWGTESRSFFFLSFKFTALAGNYKQYLNVNVCDLWVPTTLVAYLTRHYAQQQRSYSSDNVLDTLSSYVRPTECTWKFAFSCYVATVFYCRLTDVWWARTNHTYSQSPQNFISHNFNHQVVQADQYVSLNAS